MSLFLSPPNMGRDSNSWEDKDVQATSIVAAGGLDKPLFLKGSGTGGLIYHQPDAVAINATATATAAQLLSRQITSTTAAAVALTLPTVVALAAEIVGGAGSRNGSKLWVGAAFDVVIVNTGGANAVTMTSNTGWTLVGEAVVVAGTSAIYQVRFTDVTVGAETATLTNLATSA